MTGINLVSYAVGGDYGSLPSSYTSSLLTIGSTLFPDNVIVMDSYAPVTKQTMDKSAKRDINGKLTRKIMTNQPSTVKFKMRGLTSKTLPAIMSIFHDNYIGDTEDAKKERKMLVTFFSPEYNAYYTETMYMASGCPTITINHISEGICYYNDIEIEMIGY